MRILGLIPARAGSKGVPRKNVRIVARRPLIAYTIEAAKGSQLLAQFVTSTDDDEIAAVAARWGSPVLRRPVELAADDSPMAAVAQHALEAVEPPEGRWAAIAVLQPTAPLRTAEDIDAALQLLIDTEADAVMSVYQVGDAHPARMYRLVDGRLASYDEEPADRLRQQLEPLYHRNGAIYACRRRLLESQGTLIGPDCRPYVMNRERSLNIDDEFDLRLADLLLRRRQQPRQPVR